MSTHRQSVLVIDDEPKNIQVVGTLLLRQGYEIVTARNGDEGLAKAKEAVPDLILVDLMMPGISGVEVVKRLKANPEWKPVPIIMLSAATDKSFILEALQVGVVDYVTKPFHGPELLRRIELHLGLRKANRALEEAVAEKNRLIEVLAHDLKNPLGSVRFAARLLEEQKGSPKIKQLTDVILDASNRAIEIVESLLEIRWVENAKETLVMEKLSVEEVVRSVCSSFESQCSDKTITIETSFPDNPVSEIRADRGCLIRALENLVSNAIKFSPHDSTIHIEAGTSGGMASILVEDEGEGIRPDEIGFLFKRYSRLSNRPTGGESSTGLGLSIVKDLVTAMGGSISYQPSRKGGAGFLLALPTAN